MKNKISISATILVIVGVLLNAASYFISSILEIESMIASIVGTVLILVALIIVVSKVQRYIEDTEALRKNVTADLDNLTDIKNENKHLNSRVNELIRQNQTLSDSLDEAKAKEDAREAESVAREESSKVDLGLSFLPTSGETKVLNIIAEARKVVNEMSKFAKEAGITINLSHSSDSINVKADPKLINIMFRNIVDNSIKYMNQTGSLVITISRIADDLFIVLKDNGKGLDSEEANHIFELNFQGSNRVSGNGLGLTQSKAIVESFGGTIYAKTAKGQGMAIYIQLPASNAE